MRENTLEFTQHRVEEDMKKYKLLQIAITLVLMLSVLLVSNKVVFGDEVAGDSKVSITINKRIWQDKAPENIQNTGEVLDFGGQPLNGSEFTVYDVSDKYYELIKGSNQKTAIEQIQSDSNQTAPIYATKIDSKVTAGEGQAVFGNLQMKNSSGRYNVYLILETKTPDNITVTKRSAPLVIALPIYKLDTNQKPSDTLNLNIQLYPKNETSKDVKEFVNIGSFNEVKIGNQSFANVTTGDILNYKLTINIPANIGDSNAVTSFKIHDKPSDGLALADQNVQVVGLTQGNDYSIEYTSGGGLTVSLNLSSNNVKALAGQKLQLTYNMKLTAEVSVNELQNNKASVQINNSPEQEITPPVPVGTGGYKFIKKDAQTVKNLSGAEFVVTNKDQTKFIKFSEQKNSKGEYVFNSWVDKESEASKVISGDDGSIKIIGLSNGDYILNETKAPSTNYVLLEKGTVKFTVEHGKYGSSELEVKNTPKGLLPATGGSGIYIFLVVGTFMMIMAGLLLRKSRNHS